MAFNIEVINKSIGLYVLILLGIPTIVTSNIDCGRKPFHCVNATHFMICVDLGGGVSRTIDNYVYECPSPTECQPSNNFECEFPEATTQPSRVSDVTNELLVNNNTTLRSEDTIATISSLTNTSQAIQPEAILTIDVTSTATTNSYRINDQNITDNASNHTNSLLINFTPGNMVEKTDGLNNDIITNVTTTLPVESMSSSTTTFTIYITSEDMVNGTASTNNILGIENVTETTERVNSSTDQVTSSTFLILNETNSKTDSLSTDIASSTTSGDDGNASTIDIPPKDNTNKSVVSGDALDITNNTENVFSTQSEVLPNTFVTLPSVTETSEGILTTLVITEGTAIIVSTDKSATENQFEYESSAIPITNNITETNANADGLISINGITGEVATTTSPTLADSKNVTAIVDPNNFPIDSVTSNNDNINKVETNQITEATTFSTDGLPSTLAYQYEYNTDKNYTSNNIGNNKTVSTVDEKPNDNINKSYVSSSALDIKNKSENLSPQKPEFALPNTSVTLPSVVVSSESTITTVVITEGTAVTISTNESSASTAYNQSEGESTAIINSISEYYSTSETSTLTSKIRATDAIETTTVPLITDIKNDVTTIVEQIDLPVESVISNNDNVNKDVITKVTDGASVSTDESIRSTMDHIFEVTTRKYDVSNNITNNKTVSTIDEHPKHNTNKSEASNNALEIENRTENVPFTSAEGVLSNISASFPSVTASSEGTKITLVTTEVSEITTSADNNSTSTAYNQSEGESSATAITKNISEYYSTTETSTLTSKIGATDAIEMTTAPLITDIKNDVTVNLEPIYLPVDSVTSNIDNVNKDVITKVTDGASVSTDESIRSTMDHPFEVTTRKYDVSNNITNNKTVSTIDEHPKHNANKSEVTNNAIEIENITENVLFTSSEGVVSNISGTFPSETVSSEGTIITLVTEATEIITSADNNSASTIYNQSENVSSTSTINNNNFSEHFFTTEALILTSKTADNSANETTMDPTIADTKNYITTTVEPIDLVTSNNVNENKDEVSQFNVSTTISTDQSVRSTTDYLFKITTNKYDISDTNNKTVSTIEVQPEDIVNKSDVSNNTTEIGNRTENGIIVESEVASSNILSSLTPVAASDDATASIAVITEGTTITISIDENLLTVTDKQPEENTTDVINNISVTNFTTENITFTSQSVTADPTETIVSSTIAATKSETATVQPITLPTVTSNDADVNKDLMISVTEAIAVSTDQGIRSTIDSQFQVSTNQHDTSKVNNNKIISTIDEKLKSNDSNNAIENKNRTENLLPPGSEVDLPIITVTVPSVEVPSESTTSTDVITTGIVTTTYTNNNPASNMDKQPGHEISATTIFNIFNNISETYSTLDGITLTTKTEEYKMTTDSIIAPTKDVMPDAEPIALPTDSVTSLNSKQDVLSQVTESTTFSKDQSLISTLDYEFEQNTNKTVNVHNKTLATIDGNPQDKVNKPNDSTNAKEIENQTENSLLTGAEDTLSNILITSTSGAAASESTITTVLVREGTDIPMSTEKNLTSSIGKQPEYNEIVTDIFTNISATENLNSSSQKVTADPTETITVPISAFTKDEEAIIKPITLPITSVTSNYGNGNQDILITVTETTVISNDQTTRSTIDYKLEENTNQYNIPYNANNKSENSATTVLDPIYLNSIDKNEAVNISNGKVTEKPTGLPLDSITLPLAEASSEGIISVAVDDTNNTPVFESKQVSTYTENTTGPSYVIPGNFVSVKTLNDLNSSTHVSNQDTKATTKIESSTSSVSNVQSSDNTESTKIYLQAESEVTNMNNKESKKISTVEMSILPPVVTEAVPVLPGQTDVKPAISTSSTSTFTDKATKKVIEESHFAEKENSVTETNIPTLRDTSSPSYASKAIYTPNTNANTQSFIKNIHEHGSSVNNGFTNVMQEGTTKDVIKDFNKNNNVISTLQTSPPMSSKTNSYKDSTHKSPSQFSTSHVVETGHSVKNSTSAIGQVSNDNPLINIVFNNNNTNIHPITSLVINETNWNNKIHLNSSNSTKPTSENSLLHQNWNNKPQQHSHDNRNSNKRSEDNFNCNHHRRGRYADQDNCRKFYICIGRLTPIVGECPANTVFSEHTKQCTKNLSHCVRGNQFHCETSGRFSDLTQQSVYYICVKNKLDSYVRFKFQCQEGYSLNKETVRCIETEPERSISNDNKSKNERKRNRYNQKNEQRSERENDSESVNENERKRNRYHHKSEQRSEQENYNESENENERKRNRYGHKNEQRRQRKNERDSEDEKSESKEFECEEEGKFAHPDNCRQYYKCSKNRRSEYRRKIKSCDSDELFDESKKKCVDAESYECQKN